MFVPVVGVHRAQRGQNALEILRALFTAFALALVLIGFVVAFLAAGSSQRNAMSAPAVAVAVAVFGVASLFVPRILERPLDCSTPAALVTSYRTRFFLRLAFADSAALVGFVGFLLTDEWWLYPLGGCFSLLGFMGLAPTRRNLERDQEALNLSGCGHALTSALTASTD